MPSPLPPSPLLPPLPPLQLAPTLTAAMADTMADTMVDTVPAAPLRLDWALALLRHAGQPEPAGTPGSPPYLQGLIDALVELSSRDALTGIANRRSFELALAREVDRVARSAVPALLLYADIDHFKRINDQHGHAVGDEVIRAVAQALAEVVRPMDLVARIGGEEFALLLPNCPPAFAPQVGERLRQRVAQRAIALSDGRALSATVSIGGAFAPQWVRSTPGLWMARADLQLYRAKAEGRNRVCLEDSASSEVSAAERAMLLATPDLEGPA